MTDRPHAGGSTETAAGPAPGYYPDPSIPGFVRYWGGSAWVPGTSRPAPAEGEVLEPPRYATRRPGVAGGGVGARYVPPPVVAEPAVVEPVVEPVARSAVHSASGGDTGPVYLDQTAGGASFTFAVPENGPVFHRAGGPSGDGSGAAPGPGPGPGPGPELDPGVESDPGPEALAGWQVDPRAQRGLMETGSAPRWVSWGVLPGAEEPAAEPVAEPVAEAPAEAPAPEEAPEPAPAPVPPSPSTPEAAEPRSVPAPRTPARVASVEAEAPAPTLTSVPVAEPASASEVELEPTEGDEPSPAAPAAARPSTAGRPSTTPRRRTGARPVVRPAGLGRRFAARLVDTAVLAVVAVAAGLPLGRSVEAHLQDKLDQARMASRLTRRQVDVWLVDGTVVGKVAVLLGILLFVGLLYEVLPTARTGQTFGKRLARIRVVATARAGSAGAPDRPGLGRSLVRWLVRQVSTLLVVGLLWPLFDRPARRGWHDRAARTKVVRL
ncbi:RDD family protein [Kitasatospora misakiensis]|uniref:RDD family protein n=1 Tax=Kitasatospora misakiensis TaxID=67330 RepID=A0ABW0X4L7_9ACTN